MRTKRLAGMLLTVALGLSLAACKDTKMEQENAQLKAQVAELQKENGQLGNDLETMTASRDALAKENAELKTTPKRTRGTAGKATRRRHHRRR